VNTKNYWRRIRYERDASDHTFPVYNFPTELDTPPSPRTPKVCNNYSGRLYNSTLYQ
jgi:hypothetical protein